MARMVLLAVPLFLCLGSAMTQSYLPGFGAGQQICNYQYAVPNGGNCVTYGPSLEHHLDVVQQDLDRVKLQFISQNTVLQEELRKLRQQNSATSASVTDLSKDLNTLKGTVAALQASVARSNLINNNNNNGGGGGGTASSAMLQQLVTTTRTQLSQDISKLESQLNAAIASVQSDRQRDGIQQSKVDSAFQAELRQQQMDLTSVNQKLQQLQNRVTTLEQTTAPPQYTPPVTAPPRTTPTTTTTTTTTTAPATTQPVTHSQATQPTTPDPRLQQLESDVKALDQRLQKMEADYQKDVPTLKTNVSYLMDLTHNQSLTLSSVELETRHISTQEIPKLTSDVDILRQVAQSIRGTLNPLQQQVNRVAQNVSDLNNQVSILGTESFNVLSRVRQDETELQSLTKTVDSLGQSLNTLISTNGFTTPSTTAPSIIVPTPMNNGNPTPRQTGFVMPTPRPNNG